MCLYAGWLEAGFLGPEFQEVAGLLKSDNCFLVVIGKVEAGWIVCTVAFGVVGCSDASFSET